MQSDDRSRRRTISRASLRRRRVTLIGALAAVAALVQAASAWVAPPSVRTGAARAAPSSVLRVTVPSRSPLTYVLADYRRSSRLDHEALARAVRRDLPSTVRIRRGTARVTYRYDLTTTLRRVKRTPPSGATVAVARRAISARVPAPVVAQALRNNCESAALSILLATQGARVGQLTLQGELPRSGALDPATTASGRVWGDPERGYVGRPDGGGGAGGFGVYPRPVAAVAARHDVRLTDLSSDGPSAVYKALRQGRAVMAWIGLSDGPYGTWSAPEGRRVQVNFGEHTIVLHGIAADGTLEVSNPLRGTRERLTPGAFETLFARLGMRALATTRRPPQPGSGSRAGDR